jgi:hypothetical protein
MRAGGIALAVLLSGCASTPPPQQPEAEPPYRQLIAENLDILFSQDSQMRGVSISGLRRGATPAGPEWRVCLRGTANAATGGAAGVKTYVVFISRRNEITDRRLARPEDGCDQERYERLARA